MNCDKPFNTRNPARLLVTKLANNFYLFFLKRINTQGVPAGETIKNVLKCWRRTSEERVLCSGVISRKAMASQRLQKAIYSNQDTQNNKNKSIYSNHYTQKNKNDATFCANLDW